MVFDLKTLLLFFDFYMGGEINYLVGLLSQPSSHSLTLIEEILL